MHTYSYEYMLLGGVQKLSWHQSRTQYSTVRVHILYSYPIHVNYMCLLHVRITLLSILHSPAIARKMVLVDVESPAATDELVRLEREERRRPQLLERAKALAAIASASASASEEPSVAPTTTTTATEATDVTNAEVSRASGSVAVLHEREPALPVPSSRPLDKQLVQVMSHLMQSSVLHGATMHSTSVKNQAHQWPAHHSKSHQLPPRLLNAAAASAAAAAASSSGVEAIARESRSVEEIEAELLGKWVNRPGAGLPGLDSKQLIGRQVLPLHAFIRALRHENAVCSIHLYW